MAKSKHKFSRIILPEPKRVKTLRGNQLTPEGLAIIKRLELIAQTSLNTQLRLKHEHPEWIEADARLTVFANLYNGLNVTYLSVIFIETSVNNANWWKDNFPDLDPHDIRVYQHGYALNTRHNFGMTLFILVEKMFRVFLRAIDPVACNGSTAEFESIYTCLLKTKISNPPPESLELLELIRLVRNTIHNDGIYLHKKGFNDAVVYKGVKYEFINEVLVSFVTWDFLLMMASDIHDLFATILSDKAIAQINQNIFDPTYKAI